jgi:WhiB family redox-sensing transcriptional regulator
MESAITGPGDWRDNAACRDADPDLFFPIGTTGPALRQVQEAIRICQTCPIQVRCLAWALEQGVIDGVWGGTTAEQRAPPPVAAGPRWRGRSCVAARWRLTRRNYASSRSLFPG